MSTRYSRIKQIKEWVRWNTHTADELADVEGIAPEIREALKNVENDNWLFYDENSQILRINNVELVHTQSAARIACIEGIRQGNSLSYIKNEDNLTVTTLNGTEVGEIPSNISNYIQPLLENNDCEYIKLKAGEVIPRSQRGKGAKKAICNVEIEIKIKKIDRSETKSIVCLLGGDQINLWVQKLEVKYLNMPSSDVKLMFEIYNRQCEEYNDSKTDTGYAGLDNLEDEIKAARVKMRDEKESGLTYSIVSSSDDNYYFLNVLKAAVKQEPKRYGNLLKYFSADELTNGYIEFKELFDNSILDEETYYWVEQTRVEEPEYEKACGEWMNHWYEVMEAFEGSELPIDLSDTEVVSILGTDRFIAFADLSYGC